MQDYSDSLEHVMSEVNGVPYSTFQRVPRFATRPLFGHVMCIYSPPFTTYVPASSSSLRRRRPSTGSFHPRPASPSAPPARAPFPCRCPRPVRSHARARASVPLAGRAASTAAPRTARRGSGSTAGMRSTRRRCRGASQRARRSRGLYQGIRV